MSKKRRVTNRQGPEMPNKEELEGQTTPTNARIIIPNQSET